MLQTWRDSYLLVLSPLGLQGLASLFEQLLLLTQILRLPLQLLFFVPELGLKPHKLFLCVQWLGVQSLRRRAGERMKYRKFTLFLKC